MESIALTTREMGGGEMVGGEMGVPPGLIAGARVCHHSLFVTIGCLSPFVFVIIDCLSLWRPACDMTPAPRDYCDERPDYARIWCIIEASLLSKLRFLLV
jgi:hypothetical protein